MSLLVAGVLLLASCLKADVDLEVRDDGSGTLRLISAVDVEALEGLAESFGDEGDLSEGPSIREQVESIDPSELPEGATIEFYDDGRFQGIELTVEFEPGTDIAQLLDEGLATGPSDATDVTGGGMFESFLLEPDGEGGWRFEASLPEADDLGAEGMPPEMLESLIGNPEIRFAIRLPGRQVEHNADRIEGDGTMVWELGLTGEGEQALSARTVPGDPITGGDDGGLSPIVIGLLVVAAVLGTIAIVMVVRNGRSAAAPPTATPPPAIG
ncbi:MAG TPA: hypothetical protein VK866_15695 [Acidimicrobiales bacterium]|nr:hypothetical protein [Acidimicrobiales bacterium]